MFMMIPNAIGLWLACIQLFLFYKYPATPLSESESLEASGTKNAASAV